MFPELEGSEIHFETNQVGVCEGAFAGVGPTVWEAVMGDEGVKKLIIVKKEVIEGGVGENYQLPSPTLTIHERLPELHQLLRLPVDTSSNRSKSVAISSTGASSIRGRSDAVEHPNEPLAPRTPKRVVSIFRIAFLDDFLFQTNLEPRWIRHLRVSSSPPKVPKYAEHPPHHHMLRPPPSPKK